MTRLRERWWLWLLLGMMLGAATAAAAVGQPWLDQDQRRDRACRACCGA